MNGHGSAEHSRPASLTIYRAAEPESLHAFWRINGHLATLYVWTDEAYRRLAEPPPDAQYHPCGIWCALRIED
jgi:hypothetical protein